MQFTLNKRFKSVNCLSLACSPDGKYLAYTNDSKIVIKNLSDEKAKTTEPRPSELYAHESKLNAICYSPDGKLIAGGGDDCTVRIWNVSTGKCLLTSKEHEGKVKTLCFSPNGKYLVSGGADNKMYIWDIPHWLGPSVGKYAHPIDIEGHRGAVNSVCFCYKYPDILYSGSADYRIGIWCVSDPPGNGQGIHKVIDESAVTSLCRSPNDELLCSGRMDGNIRVWDADKTCQGLVLTTLVGHDDMITSMCFSSDSRFLYSASKDDTIKVWDLRGVGTTGTVKTRKCLATLTDHTDVVTSICLSPDGKWLYSASKDNTIVVWKIEGQAESKEDDENKSNQAIESLKMECKNLRDEIRGLHKEIKIPMKNMEDAQSMLKCAQSDINLLQKRIESSAKQLSKKRKQLDKLLGGDEAEANAEEVEAQVESEANQPDEVEAHAEEVEAQAKESDQPDD